MIQQMLAVWSLVPLPFLKPAWTSGSLRLTYCWSLVSRILNITSVWDECNCAVVWAFFGIAFLWDWGQEAKGMTEDEMAGWHHQLDGREFEWTPGDGGGQGGLTCCSPWGCKESDTTERLIWTELNYNKMSRLYIYIHPLFLGFPSHLCYHKALNTVRCAIQ